MEKRPLLASEAQSTPRPAYSELEDRPLPAAGFPPHHRDSGKTLHARTRRKPAARPRPPDSGRLQGRLQTFRMRLAFNAVDGAQRSHNHFARRERRDQSDADLPVEAQRLDDGLDRLCRSFRQSCRRSRAPCRCAAADAPAPTAPIATSRITVPARRRKTFARSTAADPSDCRVGQR